MEGHKNYKKKCIFFIHLGSDQRLTEITPATFLILAIILLR